MVEQPEMLDFFKALADASRLKILGLLAQQPRSVEELSSLLELKPSTVSHHLGKLAEIGLVFARASGWYSIYELDQAALDSAAQRFLSGERFEEVANKESNAYDRKVLEDFSSQAGHLVVIPAKRKKLEAVLRHMVKNFELGRQYSEKEVNEILKPYNEDTATLRRELIGYGFLVRDDNGSAYQRVEE